MIINIENFLFLEKIKDLISNFNFPSDAQIELLTEGDFIQIIVRDSGGVSRLDLKVDSNNF